MTADMTIQSKATRVARLRLGARDLLCDIRQWQYPSEFRVSRPRVAAPEVATLATEATAPTEPATPAVAAALAEDPAQRDQAARLDRAVAKVAVCLWDIRRKLEGSDAVRQDRKLRLLPRRAEAAITALEDVGVSIDDPIGRRYPPGSEGSMNPSFLPTPGATEERVVETIAPIIYRDDRLIGRGDVFVAVPASIERDSVQGAEAGDIAADPPTADDPTQGANRISGISVPPGDQLSSADPPGEPAAGAPIQDPEIDSLRNEGH